jgi:two-component system OmpR family sensor kinase
VTSLVARLPLRVRLTLAFAFVSAILLAGVGVFIFLQVKSGLDASLDASLRTAAGQYARLVAEPTRGPLRRALAVEGDPAQLLSADGRVLAASPSAHRGPLLRGARLREAGARPVLFERREAVRLLGRPTANDTVFVISTSMVQRERALEELGSVLLVGGLLILVLSSGAGFLVASGALRPVERMRRRASEISRATPDAQLPLPRAEDELRSLGVTLNEMLGRLRDAAEQERAFLTTASHELRTPLAILKTEVELALHEHADELELRRALASVGEEADRLIRLAEDLLVGVRDGEGQIPLDPSPVRLDEVAGRVAARLAASSGAQVRSRVAPGTVVVADAHRVEQALNNLVDNALRHGAAPVELTADSDGDAVELHVIDHGRGFPAESLDDVFTRGSGGRAGGFGLGLSIVAAIARAHGGSVGARNAAEGADVWMRLPLAGPPAS